MNKGQDPCQAPKELPHRFFPFLTGEDSRRRRQKLFQVPFGARVGKNSKLVIDDVRPDKAQAAEARRDGSASRAPMDVDWPSDCPLILTVQTAHP